MRPAVHRRFLDYRETFPYFRSVRDPMLGPEDFARFDAEHEALAARDPSTLSEDEATRLGRLRKLLLRD